MMLWRTESEWTNEWPFTSEIWVKENEKSWRMSKMFTPDLAWEAYQLITSVHTELPAQSILQRWVLPEAGFTTKHEYGYILALTPPGKKANLNWG